jgi:hypothetical protein
MTDHQQHAFHGIAAAKVEVWREKAELLDWVERTVKGYLGPDIAICWSEADGFWLQQHRKGDLDHAPLLGTDDGSQKHESLLSALRAARGER